MFAGEIDRGTKSIDVLIEVSGGIGSLLSFRPRIEWNGMVRVPLRAVERIEDSIKPVKSPELDRAVRRSMALSLTAPPDYGRVHVHIHIDRPAGGIPEDVALGIAADLVKNGDIIDTVVFTARIEPWHRPGIQYTGVLYNNSLDAIRDEAESLKIRIRGDAVESLREFHRSHYWAGEVLIPIADLDLN